jgi:hypothetical protein
MIAFLNDIYGSPIFKSGSIKRGNEEIPNPCLSILACITPQEAKTKIKSGIFSGGFARRMTFIYTMEEGKIIAFPEPPKEHTTLWKNLLNHLIKVESAVGQFTWEPEAREEWEKWYHTYKKRDKSQEDDFMKGYMSGKRDLVLKLTMLLALAEEEIRLIITKNNFLLALSHLTVIETNMHKLFAGSGRNELAGPTQDILNRLESKGGMIQEKELDVQMRKELGPMEYQMIIRSLKKTEEIFEQDILFGKVSKRMILTKKKYAELVEAQQKKKV